jgi:hypothetical protein
VEANVPLSEFPEDYKQLSYAQKRGIVQEIAYFMARNEESSISEAEAIECTSKTLVSFPNVNSASPAVVLRSIIERSGVLREQRPGTVDFIHNTIKEFLSAEVFVRNGDVPLLAKHAGDDVWKQIILFASATSDRTFATKLVGKILDIADSSDATTARRFRLTLLIVGQQHFIWTLHSFNACRRLSVTLFRRKVWRTPRCSHPAAIL